MTEYLLAGRYRLTDRIAAGGMGEVWRGIDVLLNRQVAVKLLPSVREGNESSLARFRAEARYAASLSHPGIARVYDYGESSEFGGAYLVMELVDGDPLSAILARNGRLSADATLDIVAQAARALDAAHQAGIIHRDIKPGNILIGSGGTAKITDFGIATALRQAQAIHLTQTGMVMGTAMYVSPEQATGAPVTPASDIYSLGVVAFECLAGRPPFTANEPLAIAYAHKHDPVPPLPPDVPPPVVDLVLAMLAKTPDGRPPSVRAVADRAEVLREALLGPVSGPPGPLAGPLGPLSGPVGPVSGPGPVLGTGAPLATGPVPRGAQETRADMPAMYSTSGMRADDYSRPTATATGPNRRLLTTALTVLICAIIAGIGFYASGSLFKTTGGTSHTTLNDATTPAAPQAQNSSPAPSVSAHTAPNQITTTAPSRHHERSSPPPVRQTPPPAKSSAPASPSASASPSSSPSPSASPTSSSSPTSSPTASASPTN